MNRDEWRQLALITVPQLEKYCAEFGIVINGEALLQHVKDHDDWTVYIVLESIWDDLPNIPAIHVAPFDAICSLVENYPNE